MYRVNSNGNKGIISIDVAEQSDATPSISEETLATADF